MRTTKPTRLFFDLAVLALVLSGGFWTWNVTSSNRELTAELAATRPVAEQSSVRDRLIGTAVPLASLGIGETDPAAAHLVWIVDLSRCQSCLSGETTVWNALGEDASLERHVVAFADDEVPERARRVLRGTAFRTASRRDIYEAFGPLLPNTKVLLDGAGVVLMADSRPGVAGCDWNFEGSVGALRGTLPSVVIRS